MSRPISMRDVILGILGILGVILVLIIIGAVAASLGNIDEEQPSSFFIESTGQTGIVVDKDFPRNQEVRDYIEEMGYELEVLTFNVSNTDYTNLEERFFPSSPEEKAELDRWRGQWEHKDNVRAFNESIARIQEDRVVDRVEAEFICTSAIQWETQIRAAREFIEDYKLHEPELVSETATLRNLDTRSEIAASAVQGFLELC